jgi:hypothetical protein
MVQGGKKWDWGYCTIKGEIASAFIRRSYEIVGKVRI